MPGGRPPRFKSVDELEKLLDEFIYSGEPITMTGLALHLGFINRQSMYDYEAKPEFTCAIKKARAMVENSYELALAKGNGNAGHIFALKNFGWSDRTQQEISGPDGGAVQNDFTVKFVNSPE